MTEKKTTWARVQMLLIAMVFFGPLAVAAIMYYSGALQPDGRTNHGVLLEPISSITEALPESELVVTGDGHWAMVYVNASLCDDDCIESLYRLRQSRLMLGKEMDRVLRVFLHGESAPDTVFLQEAHAGLITLRDSDLLELLNKKKPAELANGGYYLVDPLGNLVMYFEPHVAPADMVEDIKHLLKFSRIG